MKYCITGGSGFIGSYFCETLKAGGHEVVILDLIDPPSDNPHDRFVKGDVRDPEAVADAVAGCDRVVHLAAAHHDFGITEKTFYDVNEGSAKVLCDAMDAAGITQCCFYSTVALYGDGNPPFTEESTPAPNSPYGGSKLKGEKVFEAWCAKGGDRRCLVIRPTVTFGPRNFANMYTLIRQIAGGKFLFVGKGNNFKSLSYVENIVDATFFLFDKQDAGGVKPFDIFNYVEKPDQTSRETAETIYKALGKPVPGWSIPMWMARILALPFDIVIALTGKNLSVSSARLIKLFAAQTKFESDKVLAAGYKPKVPLPEGINRMVKWYEAGGKDITPEWHRPPAEVSK